MRRAAILTATVLLFAAAPAAAATIEVTGAQLRVDVPGPSTQDASRTAGQVRLLPDGGAIVVLYGPIPSAAVTIGPGCTAIAHGNEARFFFPQSGTGIDPSHAATCSMTDVRALDIELRSNSGSQGWRSTPNLPTRVVSTPNLSSSATAGDAVTTGGGGDTITTSAAGDYVDPGGAPKKGQEAFPPTGNAELDDPARNLVTAGGGDDTIDLGAAPGIDTVNAGAGTDTVTYARRFASIGSPGTVGVRVTLDGVANDGDPDINAPATNASEGDNIGTDVENLIGTKLEDFLEGSASANRIEGLEGADTLRGLSGQDTVVSREPASAGSGTADTISCGLSNNTLGTPTNPRGTSTTTPDTLESDLADPTPFDCETIVQMAVDEQAAVKIASAAKRDGRKLEVALKCPKAAKRRCRGALRYAGEGSPPTSFAVPSGARRNVVVRLSGSHARSLRGRKRTARLEATETGNEGDITTLFYVRLRG